MLSRVDLTKSYERAIPEDIQSRYAFGEVRNAAAVLSTTAPELFLDILDVLRGFALTASDLLLPGGNESTVAKKVNRAFRERGWREARVDTAVTNTLVIFPYKQAGEKKVERVVTEPLPFEGYKADWMRDRVAGDCEWNAKDGNLDRNMASYRALYEAGFIDVAVIITRTQDDLRVLEGDLISGLLAADRMVASSGLGVSPDVVDAVVKRIVKDEKSGGSRYATSTTTNLPKLEHRLKRGDGGGCPVLAIAISKNTWDGSTATTPAST